MHETGKDAICLFYVDFYGIKMCALSTISLTFVWSIYLILCFCITPEALQI